MMDNCLASNSETGGVGCDNMTMAIVGILNGQTKEEWYEKVAQRVANGDGPCAPEEYGQTDSFFPPLFFTNARTAEFRGPGVHHNFDDSDSGYDMDMDQRSRNIVAGSKKGRIILLGDGSEILTGPDDADMIDHEEDEDLVSQVQADEHEPLPTTSAIPDKITHPIIDAKEALESGVTTAPAEKASE
jgi:protein phosphatase 2C family protein 2/3